MLLTTVAPHSTTLEIVPTAILHSRITHATAGCLI
jgi:hypothetical protein